jgi:LemA protein
MFPSNLMANAFNFSESEFFEVAESEKAVPKVKF